MKKRVNGQESLHVLLTRSVTVTVAVIALLLGLRLGGVTQVAQDTPVQIVEGIVQMATGS